MLVADEEVSYIWNFFNPDQFKEIDLIIACGDLKAEYLSFLVTMINVPVFYVPGNHDKGFIDNPPEGCECIDGKVVKYKNIRILGLGGSYAYNSDIYQYSEKQMQKRISKLKPKLFWNKGFDILVTHAPGFKLGDGEDLCHRGFKSFNKLLDKYSPKYFLHGHQHLRYGLIPRIIEYNNTKIINGFEYYIFEY